MKTIGIFDSGTGGLSVFREIYKLLPNQKYIYYSDNAHCPYGRKTKKYIIERCREITRFLIDKGADIIVIACNTATGAAISTLRKEFKIKFIGMEPAVKPAALATKSGVIGVLATAGTLKSSKYLMNKEKYEEDIDIQEHRGKGWVQLVEEGKLSGEEVDRKVEESVRPLIDKGADNLVLGCTHYPFLLSTIRKIVGPDIKIIDPAPAVARQLVNVMAQEGLLNPHKAKQILQKALSNGIICNESKEEEIEIYGRPKIELISSGNSIPINRIFRMIFPQGPA